MGYFNRVTIIDCDDSPGNQPAWKGLPDGMDYTVWNAQRMRNWALANDDISDDDLVDEIHSYLNEAADRSASDMSYYLDHAENLINLFRARADLKQEREEEEEAEFRQEEKDMLESM